MSSRHTPDSVRHASRVRAGALYVLGGAVLAVEGAVHLQQLLEIFHAVAWIGPLFALNAAGCAVTIAGLALPRTRPWAAVAGIGISAAALVSLAVSATVGLFGWMETTLRTPIVVAIVSEAIAIVVLAAALLTELRERGSSRARPLGDRASRSRRHAATVSTRAGG